jgi:hypothetical protein
MASELWEIVRADELVPDDVYTCDSRLKPANVDRLWRGGGNVTLYLSGDHTLMNPVSMASHGPVFRRYTGHHPGVLMRALENACEAMRVPQGGTFTPTYYIRQAEAEIAKERGA